MWCHHRQLTCDPIRWLNGPRLHPSIITEQTNQHLYFLTSWLHFCKVGDNEDTSSIFISIHCTRQTHLNRLTVTWSPTSISPVTVHNLKTTPMFKSKSQLIIVGTFFCCCCFFVPASYIFISSWSRGHIFVFWKVDSCKAHTYWQWLESVRPRCRWIFTSTCLQPKPQFNNAWSERSVGVSKMESCYAPRDGKPQVCVRLHTEQNTHFRSLVNLMT